jgi:hypothetical protein
LTSHSLRSHSGWHFHHAIRVTMPNFINTNWS